MKQSSISPEIQLEYLAMNIVHQIGDALYEALPKDVAHEHFVDARQATNDIAIDFAKKLISEYAQKKYQEGELNGLRLATYCVDKDSAEESRILNQIQELEKEEQ